MSDKELLKSLEQLRDRLAERAADTIAQEEDAYYLFGYLDEVPDGWKDQPALPEGHPHAGVYFEPTDEYSFEGAKTALQIQREFCGLKLPDGYRGPYPDHSGEAERSRNCPVTGVPLYTSLLDYGMESELEHFEGEWAREPPHHSDDFYWLWKLADECCDCEEYREKYGVRVIACATYFLETAPATSPAPTP